MKKMDFNSVIEKIYAASLEPELWQNCIDEINKLVDGRSGFIYSFNASTNETTDGFFTSDHDQEYLKRFLEYYVHTNPYPHPIHNLAPAGIPLFDEMVLPRDQARNTEYYRDWVKPQGLDICQIGCKVVIDKDRFVTLGTHVRPETYEEKVPHYHDVLSKLIPHITRAVKINQIIKAQAQTQRNLHGIFDKLDMAILITDHRRHIQTMNSLAKSLLHRGDLISIDPHDSALAAAHNFCKPQFERALDACVRNLEDLKPQTFCLLSTIDEKRFVTWVQLANEEHFAQFDSGTLTIDLESEDPMVAVLISIPQTHKGPSIEVVQSMLDLTFAEAKLATALANGESLKSYAESTEVSQNTVRTQLSSIFHKTGIKRQAELVAHIWKCFGALRA